MRSLLSKKLIYHKVFHCTKQLFRHFFNIFLIYLENIKKYALKYFFKKIYHFYYIIKLCFCQVRRTLLIKLFLNKIKSALEL